MQTRARISLLSPKSSVARRLVRKMRGGSQAHLLEASDGRFYVVKFENNPQHRRILVNEWIAARLLSYLGLSTPEVAMIQVTEEFLTANPGVTMQVGNTRLAPTVGWHFGSCFPGDPACLAVYDFLPDVLLPKVENLTEFLGMLAFDKWIGNADSRQAIFFRAPVAPSRELENPPENPPPLRFIAQMMDNGDVFGGPHWRLTESPMQGLYFPTLVYSSVRGFGDFEPWLGRISRFPEAIVARAWKEIPPEWLAGDGAEFERLLERLLSRCRRLPELIADCGDARIFPAWDTAAS
jgi:hypothetical protein